MQRSTTELEAFDPNRLLISIYESCKHRPDAIHVAGNLTQQVVQRLLDSQTTPGLITRDQLVAATHAVLHSFDRAAATFFAAYHPLSDATTV